jgi:hypothetical protein
MQKIRALTDLVSLTVLIVSMQLFSAVHSSAVHSPSRHSIRRFMSYWQKWFVTLVLTMAVQCPPVAIAIMFYHTVKYYWTKAKLTANIYGLTGNGCPSRRLTRCSGTTTWPSSTSSVVRASLQH